MSKLDFILLIDDSDADNHYHEIVIRRAKLNCSVRSIDSSLDALDYLRRGLTIADNTRPPLPQLILLDINIPALNGFELLEKLRELPDPHDRRKDLRIFMLSGSMNPDDQTTAHEKYSDLVTGFCVKPLTDEIILGIKKQYFPD